VIPLAGSALTISSAIALIAPASRFVRISMVAHKLRDLKTTLLERRAAARCLADGEMKSYAA
jgi:hypothetical protein